MDFKEVTKDAYAEVVYFKSQHGRAFAVIVAFVAGLVLGGVMF